MAARAQAECVIVGTDILSAVGCMFRSSAIGAVVRCCPPLASLLAASWCRGTKLWARTSDTTWTSRTSDRGGAQGRLSTQVAFCAHLHEVMGSVAGLQPPNVVRLGIIDGHYMVGCPATIAASWPALEASLAQAGYEMRRHKCKVWAPGGHLCLSLGAKSRLEMLTALIPEAHGAIPLFGRSRGREVEHGARAICGGSSTGEGAR